jgi:FtsP/CotA-like multicopper oxidase with cupredoxin domain
VAGRATGAHGDPARGTPWWTDTLNVGTGEVYEIEFVADNPGIWMDHCHNFQHGANGMIMHLAYLGVTTPFSAEHHLPE